MDLAVEVEGMGVPAEDILMGTMIITAATQVDIQDLETILQPTPTGMIILGLELKFKFAWCWFLNRTSIAVSSISFLHSFLCRSPC